MSVEPDPIGNPKSCGLAHVVQQHSKREGKRWLAQAFHHDQSVSPDVAFRMIFGRLLHALHGRDFGQNLIEQSRFIQQFQTTAGAAFGQDPRDFIAHAFGRDNLDHRSQPADGGEGCRLDIELQTCREADGAKQPQVVFPKSPLGIADRADDSCFQIGAATGEIEHLAGHGIEQQRVYREVAAQHVLLRIGLEMNTFRMAAIQIFEVASEGSNLNLGIPVAHQHDAEVSAHTIGAGKEPHKLIRLRGSRHIEVLRDAVQQQIPHASTHQISSVFGSAEAFNNRPGKFF